MVSPYLMHRRKAFRGGSAWSPVQLSPAIWLDASDSATLFDSTSGGSPVGANGAIARWEDKSGNARHATQATNGPLRKVAFVNGLDVAEFDRSSLHRMSHPVPVADPDNLTVAVMFRGTTGTPAEFLWCHRSENTRLIYLSWESGILYWAMRGSGNALQFLSRSLPLNQWHFAIATLNVPGNSHQLRVNGSLVGTNTYNFGAQTFTSTSNLIGDQNQGSGPVGNVFGGQMSSLVLMNSTITTTDSEKLEGYWAHRYGLTANLPGGHPYKTVAP